VNLVAPLSHGATDGPHVLLDPVGAGKGVVDDEGDLHVASLVGDSFAG